MDKVATALEDQRDKLKEVTKAAKEYNDNFLGGSVDLSNLAHYQQVVAIQKKVKELGIDLGKFKKGKTTAEGVMLKGLESSLNLFVGSGQVVTTAKGELEDINTEMTALAEELGITLAGLNNAFAKGSKPPKPPKPPGGGEEDSLWWQGGKFEAGFDKVTSKITKIFGKLEGRGNSLGENMVTGITAAFDTLTQVMDTALQNAQQKDQAMFDSKKAQLEASAGWAEKTAEEQADEIAKLEEDSFKKSRRLAKKKAQAEKAEALFKAIVSVASQVAANVAVPPLATAIAALGAIQIAAIAAAPLPQFGDGGIVSGPTVGLMGEYPGARNNPEVIAPLDKLKGMMGTQNINVSVTGEINSGNLQLAVLQGDKASFYTGGETLRPTTYPSSTLGVGIPKPPY